MRNVISFLREKKDWLYIFWGAFFLFLSSPPVDFYPFAYMAIFIAILPTNEKRKNFAQGLAFGVIYNLLTMYWIYYVLTKYGNLPSLVSLLVLLLLVFYLSLYPAIFFLIFGKLRERMPLVVLPFVGALIWVLLELIRSNFLTGFPWLLIAYTQHTVLPLIQHTKTFTVYGLSFLIIFVNISLYTLILGKGWQRFLPMGLSFLVMTYLVYSGNKIMEETKREFSNGKSIKVLCVQGNVDQSKKWDRAFQNEIVSKYLKLTGKTDAELVIWPETALPFVYGLDKEWTERFVNSIRNQGYILITGFVAVGYDEYGKGGFTNSAGLFFQGELKGRYDKIHLVPFGEYVPLQRILFFVNKLVEAAGDFIPGKEIKILEAKDLKIGLFICYEAIFPEIAKEYKKRGANLLVNITNDAWFGRSSAPYQHLAMSRFRAVENGVYLVRVANTGFSCVITPWGEIRSKTRLFEDEVFEERIFYK